MRDGRTIRGVCAAVCILALLALLSFLLDLLLGDPSWMPHPVVLMGKAITWAEPRLRSLFPAEPDGEPGTVSGTDKHSYIINCRSGRLRVLEQQLQGKKRMSAGDFMRGHKLSIGDRFGSEEV